MVAPLRGLNSLGSEQVAGGSDTGYKLRDLDMVIMNAPFTDNTKRGRKFSPEVTKQMQKHEVAIRDHLLRRDDKAGSVITTDSIRTFFTPLADKIAGQGRGIIAKIIPTTACIGSSGRRERMFLAERFHIERVVTTHDPRRINFSENTSIHESLLVCRRRTSDERRTTEFVSLRRMPANAAEAIAAADAILDGNDDWGQRVAWPEDQIRKGDWTPAQWYDSTLAEAARELERSAYLELFGLRHAIGPMGRAAQNSWKRCTEDEAKADPRSARIFDTISAKVRRTMAAEPERWVTPGGGKRVHLWEKIKKQGANLLLSEKYDTISGRLTAIYSVGMLELAPYLKSYLKSHPGVNLRLSYSRAGHIYDNVASGQIDLGIVAFPRSQRNVDAIPFAQDRMVVICSVSNPLSAQPSVSPGQLAELPLILFTPEAPTRTAVDRHFRKHGVTLRPVMELDHIATLIHAVEVDIGISLVPASALRQGRFKDTLKALPLRGEPLIRTLGVLQRKDRSFSVAARKLMETLSRGQR